MAIDLAQVVWNFNEAVSLLQDARRRVPDNSHLAKEIDEGLPDILDALREAAKALPTS